jgi:hypothetical protein
MDCFSLGDGMDRLEDGLEVVTESKSVIRLAPEQVQDYWSLFKYLNGKDRDILYLFFVAGKKQNDVREILGRSQPGLCYDIRVIRRRLKFIYYMNCIYDLYIEFLDSETRSIFDDNEVEVLSALLNTTSYTMAAKITGKSQMTVRSLFSRSLERMRDNNMWELYEIFAAIRENLNVLKRVYGKVDNSTVDSEPSKSQF